MIGLFNGAAGVIGGLFGLIIFLGLVALGWFLISEALALTLLGIGVVIFLVVTIGKAFWG